MVNIQGVVFAAGARQYMWYVELLLKTTPTGSALGVQRSRLGFLRRHLVMIVIKSEPALLPIMKNNQTPKNMAMVCNSRSVLFFKSVNSFPFENIAAPNLLLV